MLFSIIIPTYNRASFIEETLQSVMKQTYKEIEVLIIDDGSTDDTKNIVEQLANQDSKIKYFYQQNAERGVARNLGIEKALGDYLVFFDSDDIMLPSYINDLYDIVQGDPSIEFLALKFGEFTTDNTNWKPSQPKIKSGFFGLDTFLEGNSLACNFCVSKKLATSTKFVEDRKFISAEDWVYVLAVLTQTQKMYWSANTGVLMRSHDNRSMNNNLKAIDARKACTHWIAQNLNLTPLQIKKMWAFTNYFCAIHYFLEGKVNDSKVELKKAIDSVGMKRIFLLLRVKQFVGLKNVNLIKKWKQKLH